MLVGEANDCERGILMKRPAEDDTEYALLDEENGPGADFVSLRSGPSSPSSSTMPAVWKESRWPFIVNLSNSIIGVSILAMPFCLQQVGLCNYCYFCIDKIYISTHFFDKLLYAI